MSYQTLCGSHRTHSAGATVPLTATTRCHTRHSAAATVRTVRQPPYRIISGIVILPQGLFWLETLLSNPITRRIQSARHSGALKRAHPLAMTIGASGTLPFSQTVLCYHSDPCLRRSGTICPLHYKHCATICPDYQKRQAATARSPLRRPFIGP